MSASLNQLQIQKLDTLLYRAAKIVTGAQKIDFGPKTALLGTKRATLGNRCHLPENRRYPELPQDMGDL